MLVKLDELKLVLKEISKLHSGDTINLEIESDRYVAFKFISKSGQSQEARLFYAKHNQSPILYSFKTIRNTD